MSSVVSFQVVPCLMFNSHQVSKPLQCHRMVVKSLSEPEPSLSSPKLIKLEEKDRNGGGTNGFSGSLFKDHKQQEEEKVEENKSHGVFIEKLDPLWDDGYETASIEDYINQAKDIMKPDGGPPRWFCPLECGQPLKNSPVLFFLPGLDGTSVGLSLHHKALGKVFEVRCLHIPVHDRTPFEELLKFVEESLKHERGVSPRKPIYLVGESFGGCLALAVAARNPSIDLVVILANPATSFGQSQLQHLLPLLEALPDGLHATISYLLGLALGNPLKMAMAGIDSRLPPTYMLEKLFRNLIGLIPCHLGSPNIIPKDSLVWKLKLSKSAASYANSRLQAVRAEVLVLASDQDNMLPSGKEAERLKSMLKNSTVRVRHFRGSGHLILLEDGINLLTIIKGTCTYRRTSRHDYVSDFLPPSLSEHKTVFYRIFGKSKRAIILSAGLQFINLLFSRHVIIWPTNFKWYISRRKKPNLMHPIGRPVFMPLGYNGLDLLFRYASSAVSFSTLEDGKIVRGLAGVPTEGPVLYVGNHMMMGMELSSVVEEFLRVKSIPMRPIAHPLFFSDAIEKSTYSFNINDYLKVIGALPVTASNLFKLLSSRSHVLLYPGGAREATHHKGEQYKLFWPDEPEFVRMAARCGATIVPFGVVGEDDLLELVLDYNDLMKIPAINDWIREQNETMNVRKGMSGEISNQALYCPVFLPKLPPGRLYHLFGKPISTKGRREMLKDTESAKELYLQIKSEVEACMAYLIKKREEDPYRNAVDRVLFKALNPLSHEIPTFDP